MCLYIFYVYAEIIVKLSAIFLKKRHIYYHNKLLEGVYVKGIVEERAAMLGEYIIESQATVRKAAKVFGVSKSTVHKDVSQRLKYINPQLYKKVKAVLETTKLSVIYVADLQQNRNTLQ